MSETADQRAKRERQRRLFDSVAPTYQRTRQGYPESVVQWIMHTAALKEGSSVLEVGCGTGQLTVQLARHPFKVTAIDIGPAMVDAARQRVPNVNFAVSPFEEFDAAPGFFDLVISATAAHWIDPHVLWTRSAWMLSQDGWLAIMSVGEDYDEPVRSLLRAAWVRRTHGGGDFKGQRITPAERVAASRVFEPALEKTHSRRVELRPDAVMDLERTRATYLDYDREARESFDAELWSTLSTLVVVPTTIRTEVAMARPRR